MTRLDQIAEIVDLALEAREELVRREIPERHALIFAGCALGTMLATLLDTR